MNRPITALSVGVFRAASAVVVFVGVVGLLGWILDSPALKGILFRGVTIKANASVGLLLIGIALFVLHETRVPWLRWIAQAGASLAGIIGAATLAQHITGIDLGIDQLLFVEPEGALATASPNRMGPPAAISLTLAAVALVFFQRTRRGRVVAQALGLAICVIATVALLGHTYGIFQLYGLSQLTGIASHTAVAIFCLALALITMHPDVGLMRQALADDAGGSLVRRLLFPAVAVPFLLGWFRTMAERNEWLDLSAGRPLVIGLMMLSMAILVFWNAAALSRAEARRRAIEKQAETDLRRAKESAEQAREAAEAASRAKSEFLAMLSHEMRTPLAPVSLTLSLMETDPAFPAHLRPDLAQARRNLDLEVRLISDLLDITRIEHGKLQLERTNVDVHTVIRSVVSMCSGQGRVDPILKLEASRPWVCGDATRLHQVVWNLLNNAQKFTPAEGVITIATSDAATGDLQLCVGDSGCGIAPEVLARLFTPFEQGAARAGQSRAGLGLGLVIARRLVEAHGGTLIATSEGVGRGATFILHLPALAHAPVASPLASAPVPQPKLRTALRVLIVEDHEPTLTVMQRVLQRLGHTVTGAKSAPAAVAAANSGEFDLLISDLGLAGMSGLQLLQQLPQFTGRAIAVSGHGSEADLAASKAAGFATHLTKPVDVRSLERAIARVADSFTVAPEPSSAAAERLELTRDGS